MRIITVRIDETMDAALEKVSSFRIPKSEHIRRAIDIYLSTPSIRAELTHLGYPLSN